MSVVRIVLFLGIMGGLTLFVLQNASLSLSLVFLGMRSQTLPLSIWIVMSLAAGAATSFLISSLVAFSNYLAEKEWRVRSDRAKSSGSFSEGTSSDYPPPSSPRKPDLDPAVGRQSRETDGTYQRSEYGTPSSYNVGTFQQEVYQGSSSDFNEGVAPVGSQSGDRDPGNAGFSSRNDEIEDDWLEGSDRAFNQNDDWGDEEEQKPPSRNEDTAENPTNYEFQQQPKTQSWLGSVYSFGYRQPQNTGVGQTESVYDANFRVIMPPSTPTPQSNDGEKPRNNDEDDEDWGLGEDDELEDDRTSGSRRGDRT